MIIEMLHIFLIPFLWDRGFFIEFPCVLILVYSLRIFRVEVRPHEGHGEGAQGHSQDGRDDGEAEHLLSCLVELLGLVLEAHVQEDRA